MFQCRRSYVICYCAAVLPITSHCCDLSRTCIVPIAFHLCYRKFLYHTNHIAAIWVILASSITLLPIVFDINSQITLTLPIRWVSLHHYFYALPSNCVIVDHRRYCICVAVELLYHWSLALLLIIVCLHWILSYLSPFSHNGHEKIHSHVQARSVYEYALADSFRSSIFSFGSRSL